jgi:hypothetical protein
MRGVVLLCGLLLGARQAQADLDVCKSQREDAAQTPPAAEDVRALRQCLDRWRDILPRANEELKRPFPDLRAGCEAEFAAWQAASHGDSTSYDAMIIRLEARSQVDRCNAESLTAHPSAEVAARIATEQQHAAAEHARRSSRSLIIVGTMLTSLGGIGLTASGAVGLATMNRPPTNTIEGNTFSILGLAIGGLLAGVTGGTGAVLLGFGVHQHKVALTL